jgi:hypothetical protein
MACIAFRRFYVCRSDCRRPDGRTDEALACEPAAIVEVAELDARSRSNHDGRGQARVGSERSSPVGPSSIGGLSLDPGKRRLREILAEAAKNTARGAIE